MSNPVSSLEAFDTTEPYDVCVIGAGLAGSILGLRLVHAGLRVLLLESPREPSRGLFNGTRDRSCSYQISGDTNYPPMPAPLGSSSTASAWGGICERFDPCDFRAHSYTPKDNPWPIDYADLAPFYARAEQTFRVRGGSMPPQKAGHDRPLKLPTRSTDPAFQRLLAQAGIAARAAGLATPERGAQRFDPQRELLPDFLASRNGTLVSNVTPTRFRADRNGRIVGATCKAPDGTKKTARADTFIVASEGLQAPRLLLLSRSQRFPFGIGNDYDRVGRGFSDHAILTMRGYVGKRNGRCVRDIQMREPFRGFQRDGLGSIHPVFSRSPLIAQPQLADAIGGWPRRLVGGLPAPLEIACRVEIKPSDGNRVSLSASSQDSLGDSALHLSFNYCEDDRRLISKTRELLRRWLQRLGAQHLIEADVLWAGESIGTCRMGADPATSVCDPTLRVHASPNLYVCGSETFPTGGALPPALTVAALAHRLADHVAARTKWCSRGAQSIKPRGKPTAPAPAVALMRRRPQH